MTREKSCFIVETIFKLFNLSVYTVYHDIAKVISNRYDLGLQDAISCSIELCAWVNILNIIKPHDATDPKTDNSDYWATRKETGELNMKYIQDLLNGPLYKMLRSSSLLAIMHSIFIRNLLMTDPTLYVCFINKYVVFQMYNLYCGH